MNNNHCVCCGVIIPEGRMVCPSCENAQMRTGMILQSIKATEQEVKATYDFMGYNDDD